MNTFVKNEVPNGIRKLSSQYSKVIFKCNLHNNYYWKYRTFTIVNTVSVNAKDFTTHENLWLNRIYWRLYNYTCHHLDLHQKSFLIVCASERETCFHVWIFFMVKLHLLNWNTIHIWNCFCQIAHMVNINRPHLLQDMFLSKSLYNMNAVRDNKKETCIRSWICFVI